MGTFDAQQQRMIDVWEAHLAAEWEDCDADEAVSVMTEDTMLVHVPLGIGGVGRDQVRSFYDEVMLRQVPSSMRLDPSSRTVGQGRVIDEFVVHMTHDIELDWFVPGVPPTGRELAVPHVGVVGFEGDRICSEHIYWDMATVLVQLGLVDEAGLPVVGADQPDRLRTPLNRWRVAGG